MMNNLAAAQFRLGMTRFWLDRSTPAPPREAPRTPWWHRWRCFRPMCRGPWKRDRRAKPSQLPPTHHKKQSNVPTL
jgi:hypothetical protein